MSARDRIALAIVGSVVVLGLVWFMAIAPKRSEVQDVQTQIDQQQAALTTLQGELAAHSAAHRQARKTERESVMLGKAVPEQIDVPSLIYQVSASAKRIGVGWSNLSVSGEAPVAAAPADAAGGASLTSLPFQFTFDGSFFRLERFLARLERYVTMTHGQELAVGGRLMTIDSLTLTGGSGSKLSAQVGATAYRVTPAPAAPATGAPAAPGAAPVSSTSTSSTASAPPAAVVGATP
jgi:Tfp pilus assembly protein PilO